MIAIALAGAVLTTPATASPTTSPGVPAGLEKCTRALLAWCGELEVPLETASVTGTIGGRRIDLLVPAPTYF